MRKSVDGVDFLMYCLRVVRKKETDMNAEQKDFYFFIKEFYISCEVENAALLAFTEAKEMYQD